MPQPPEGSPTGATRFAFLLVALVLTGVLSLMMGSVSIPGSEILGMLWGEEPERASWALILYEFRLPKALTAMLAGASLAVSGLLMQTLFRNPLAGPTVLGITSGASLGVAFVVLVTGGSAQRLLGGLGLLGDFAVILAASLGAALVLVLVVIAARWVTTLTLLILGLLFGYATSALVTILMHFSLAEQIQAFVVWSFGSFGGTTREQLTILAPVLILGLIAALLLAKSLNALLLGEGYASSLGLDVARARWGVLVITAVLAGGVTAFCGPIAFLGVAVPHLARALFQTSDHRRLLPATALCGAWLALLADLVAQWPGSQQVLPLNAVAALFGVPVVLLVVLRQRALEASFGR